MAARSSGLDSTSTRPVPRWDRAQPRDVVRVGKEPQRGKATFEPGQRLRSTTGGGVEDTGPLFQNHQALPGVDSSGGAMPCSAGLAGLRGITWAPRGKLHPAGRARTTPSRTWGPGLKNNPGRPRRHPPGAPWPRADEKRFVMVKQPTHAPTHSCTSCCS